MMKIYLAGPDVFLPDAVEIGRRKVDLCARYGLTGLYPLDNKIDLAAADASLQIFRGNEAMMNEADAVIANVYDDFAFLVYPAFHGDFDRGAGGMGKAIGVGNDFAHHQLQGRALPHGDRRAFPQLGAQAEGDAGRNPAAAIFHQLNKDGTEIEFVILDTQGRGHQAVERPVDTIRA